MMTDGERNINMLFEQMGMDGDDAAVEQFIQENQLSQSVELSDYYFLLASKSAAEKESPAINDPLSLTLIEPVIFLASSEARNEAKLAMSSGSPIRFINEVSVIVS